MPFFRVIGWVAWKDLVSEIRSRETISSMFFFALIVILVFSFSFSMDQEAARELIAGIIWVAFAFTGIIGLGKSFAAELQNDCLEHLQISPAPKGAIYLGKLAANLLFMLTVEVILFPMFVIFFNLEEQGLLGSTALVTRADATPLLARIRLLIGVDAGSPAGEAIEWQLMGATPSHAGANLADSLARARGWTTTPATTRPISDVFPFAALGVPVLFPIPGKTWKAFTETQRADANRRFDHYHQPSDEWRADFPMTGTAYFADWVLAIVRGAADKRRSLP